MAEHFATKLSKVLLFQARARSVGAMSSDMEDEESTEPEVFATTHSETLLQPGFLVHFNRDIPHYNELAKTLIDDFSAVSFKLSI